MEFQDVESILDKSIELICQHQGLINSYVTDYFVDACQEISPEWLESLTRLQPWEVGDLMKPSSGKNETSSLFDHLPASFIEFQELCCRLNINEGAVGDLLFRCPAAKNNSWIDRLKADLGQCPEHVPAHLRKVMKPKKQYEILRQGLAISAAADAVDVSRVVDVGAGHGHLARLLAFQQGLEVTAVEASDRCAPKASKLDHEVTYRLNRSAVHSSSRCCSSLPHHITSFVSDGPSSSPDVLRADLGAVLTGLHACGDLTPTLLRRFCEEAGLRAVVSVGCCYMRCGQPWRPMSRRLQEAEFELSFEALELACHHLGSYRTRLLDNRFAADASPFKAQAFRAGFTALLARANHRLQHGTGVRCGLKLPEGTTFRRYAETLMTRLRLDDLDLSQSDWDEVEEQVEREWRAVIAFSAVRLMLGPVVELAVLLDRLLFLREQGFSNTCLIRLFESSQSPRNIAILSWKD